MRSGKRSIPKLPTQRKKESSTDKTSQRTPGAKPNFFKPLFMELLRKEIERQKDLTQIFLILDFVLNPKVLHSQRLEAIGNLDLLLRRRITLDTPYFEAGEESSES